MKKFEERLERLETIAEDIREPDIPLDDALALFDEGVKLARSLEKDLEKVEARIEILLNKPQSAEDKPELGLFDLDD